MKWYIGALRLKWSIWRMHRARRKAEAHRRERIRLEQKYPDGEKVIPLPLFMYELFRMAVVGLKIKVKP